MLFYCTSGDMLKIFNFFLPAPHIARLPEQEVHTTYSKLRWQIFISVIICYPCFYLVRYNFAFAIPYLVQQGFSKTQLGMIFSLLPLAYGCSKLLMATVSDRSNPRYFMATGLILSIVLNFFFGTSLVLNSFALMSILMFVNGWVLGMGWPALVRVMVHWFSEYERGTKMSVLGTMQNIANGIIGPVTILGIFIFNSWHSIFYFPAMLASIAVIIILLFIKDTPQAEGLPPIEEYYNKYLGGKIDSLPTNEKELTTKEILFKYVLINKYLWYLSFANVFIYLVRHGVINWAPLYLKEIKGFTPAASSWACLLYEYTAIPGMIICGWLSDKFFCSRRAPVCIIYMLATSIAVMFYWLMPSGHQLYSSIALAIIGFFIYGPIRLIGIQALDLVPKKAAGTAAGLTGFFSSVGGAGIANVGMGWIADHLGWNAGFIALLFSCVLAILFLTLLWDAKAVK